MIHVDTGFLIGALRHGSPEDGRLRRWLAEGEPVGISAVSWAEFLCGPVEAHDVELAGQVVDEPIPLLGVDAAASARLFNLTGRRRGSLNDCMIAAIASRAGAFVATTRVVDFRRFEPAGLRIVALRASQSPAVGQPVSPGHHRRGVLGGVYGIL